MKAIHKARIKVWVEALRSGEYEKGKGALRTGDTFCCLGVACEVYRRKAKKGHWNGGWFAASKKSEHRSILPREVAKWLGLTSDPVVTLKSRESVSLINLNDGRGYSFKRIAKVIEKNFLE